MRLSLPLLLATAMTAAAVDCNTGDFYDVGSVSLYMPFRGKSIACELGEGNNSEGVSALQQQINLCYDDVIAAKLKVDGDFGGKTKAAVKAVQKAVKADQDGRYGAETRGKMKWGLYFNSNPKDKGLCTIQGKG
ncbi:peptidoglycan-binding protein [Echria macrotheca]|uniref:Peptidoglycan-binding protein n=1 Tax=Echria macrotheca TaxID=438768 RepID=A0AAJ0FGA7_9PEZI|nr:peptidoglycan-binding protein [Echria macrotheca]